ncbi:MAG: DNA internalization-related competence protein ComEC/Rec2 [Pseudomonadota bacterium]
MCGVGPLIVVACALVFVVAGAWEAGRVSTFIALACIAVSYSLVRYRSVGLFAVLLFGVIGVVLSAWSRVTFEATQWRGTDTSTRVLAEVRLLNTPVQRPWGVEAVVTARDPALPPRLRLRLPAGSQWRAGQCVEGMLEVSALPERRTGRRLSFARIARIGGTAKATGSVVVIPCDFVTAWIAEFRQRIRSSLQTTLDSSPSRGVILGLVLGERHELTRTVVEQLQRTGLAHLMAISGLHIGLAAGIGFWLFRWLPLPLGFMRQDFGWIGALLVATSYALISGFGIPAQRALLATVLIALAQWQRLGASSPRLIALAVVLIVGMNPAVIDSMSFRLSFGAVCLLGLYGQVSAGWWRAPSRLRNLIGAQLVLSTVLAAATASTFGFFSLVSVAANLLCVPLFGVLIVPTLLLVAFVNGLSPSAGWLWMIPQRMIEIVLFGIEYWADRQWIAPGVAELPVIVVGFVVVCLLWSVLAARWPTRLLASTGVIILFFAKPSLPPVSCFDIRVHDVGHGLAVSLLTASSTVIFDAGPKWPGSDAGERVLAPWLRRQGIRRIDRAVQSHSDSDHAGGFDGLAKAVDIRRWLGTSAEPCIAGQNWQQGGIRFSVLWPIEGLESASDNNRSCVVLVSTSTGARALLPGDIERAAEQELIHFLLPAVRLVVVPHHGSATSSHAAFVAELHAEQAWVSNARRKGWAMPHPDVVTTWKRHGAVVRQTAEEGALAHRFCGANPAETSRNLW